MTETEKGAKHWKRIACFLAVCCVALAIIAVYMLGRSDATKDIQAQQTTPAPHSKESVDAAFKKAHEAMMKKMDDRKKHPEKNEIGIPNKSLIESFSEPEKKGK